VAQERKSHPWIIGVVLVAAVLMIGVGAALLHRALVASGGDTAAQDVPRGGRKRPEAFGFTAYPTAFGFHSTETDSGEWSAAYQLKSGTARQVQDFYSGTLKVRGWRLLEEGPTRQQPGPANPNARPVTGIRSRWLDPKGGRVLTVLALDFPQKRSTGNVLLSSTTMDN